MPQEHQSLITLDGAWAPTEFAVQWFALGVQIRHQNVGTLYEKLKQIIKV